MTQLANRWLNRLYKTIAILLVIVAVLISALRMIFPHLNGYSDEVQDYLNDYYDSYVVIGKISFDWNDVGPNVLVENVSLVQIDSTDVFIQSINVQLDFWRSLRNANVVTEYINLIGAKVYFDHTQLAPSNTQQSEISLVKRLSTIFLEQIEQFTLFGSQVIYHNENGNQTFLISELKWLNDGERHFANGDVIIDGLTSNNLSLQLDLHGNELADMSGQAYLTGQELNITPWLDEIFAIENEKTDSSINFSAWLNINKGSFDSLQLDLENNEVSFIYNDVRQTANLGYGSINIDGLSGKQALTISTTPLSVITNNQEWAPLTFEAKIADEQSEMYASSINLSGIAMLLPLFSLDESSLKLISAMNPQGSVSDIFIQNNQDALNVVAQLDNISSEYSAGIPGLKNVSGEVIYTPDNMLLDLQAKQGDIDFEQHFVLPIPYEKMSTKIHAFQDDFGWHIKTDDLKIISSEMNLAAELKLFSPVKGDMEMSLLASITEGKVTDAFHYYPHLLMGDDLVNYLNNALVSGELSKIQVLYNGSFKQFPFTSNDGKFNVDIELSDSEFLFSKQWPAITDFNANINFSNDSMLITGRSGTLTGLDVTGVRVGIDSLSKDQILTVDAAFENTLPLSIATLMNNSPLASSVGNTLNELVISKPIAGDFSLSLPLDDTDKALAVGHIYFDDNNVALQSPRMFFTKVSGALSFENENINAQALSMYWQGLPLSLNVAANNHPYHYGTDINIDAQWQQKNWQDFVPPALQSYINGELNWQAKLALAMHHDGEFSYNFDLSSPLTNFAAQLPAPFNKSVEQAMPLNIEVAGQKQHSLIRAQLGKNEGEQIHFIGKLNHSSSQFSHAQLALGEQPILLPTPNFHVSANLAEAEVSQWQPLVSDIITTVSELNKNVKSNEISLFKPLEKVSAKIDDLDIYSQKISHVTFNLLNQTSNWLMHINGDDLRAKVLIDPQDAITKLTIDTEYLHLNKPQEEVAQEHELKNNASKDAKAGSESNASIDNIVTVDDVFGTAEDNEMVEDFALTNSMFNNMPAIAFTCADCQVSKVDLGKVSFNITPQSKTEIELTDFIAKRGKTSMTAKGQWLLDLDNKQSTTFVTARIDADDLEHEMTKLAFASHIKDSGFVSDIDIQWPGGPQHFTLKQVEGKLNTQLDDGYIAKVDDKGVRLFSILSLESLVRKMTLDFRDIFSDGIFYSEIKGDFELKDGVLYTNNTRMKGTAGDVSIKGNTNLTEGIIDYRMSLKPNLTASLPVIAWITTLNPVTFLAGVALNEVITSSVVSEINYEATGPLINPDLKEVNRKTRDVRVGRSTPPEVIGEEKIIESPRVKSSNIESTNVDAPDIDAPDIDAPDIESPVNDE